MRSLGERSFASIWQSCLEAAFHTLREDELRCLAELGGCLGRYDIDRQLRCIGLCAAKLGSAAEHCAAELPERRRLHMGLAVSASALLVIVLF